MRDVLTRMGRQGLAFAVGLMLVRMVGLVVQPFLTRELPRDAMGLADNLALGANLLMLIALQGVPSGLFRGYAYVATDAAQKRSYVSSAFRYVLVSSGIIAVLAGLFGGPMSALLTGKSTHGALFVVALVTYFFSNLKNVCAQILRADLRSKEFLAVYGVEFVLCAGLNLWFVLGLKLGTAGIIYSNLIGAAVAVAMIVRFVPQAIATGVETHRVEEMARFGWPLVPSAIALLLMPSVGRFFFVHEFGEEEGLALSGLYGRGQIVATILEGVLIMPFTTIWPSLYYDLGKRPTAERDLGRCATYYVAGGAFLATGLSLIAQPLTSFVVDADYYVAHEIVPILAFGLFFFGLAEVTKVPMMLAGRSRPMSWIVPLSFLVSALCSLLLTRQYTIYGAAFGVLAAYATMAAACHLVAKRLLPIRYEWSRILKVAFASGALLVLMAQFPMPDQLTIGRRLLELSWRGSVAAIGMPALLLLLGFLDAGERAVLVRILRDPRSLLRFLKRGG
jgi:O-antigen/teichoic acid export membrane protein